MKPSIYMDIINEIERQYPVDEWSVNNVLIWPIIRLDLAMKLHNSGASSAAAPQKKETTVNQMKKVLQSWNRDFTGNKSSHADNVVFLTHSMMKTKVSGVWYDRLVDPIAENLNQFGIHSRILEYTPNNNFKSPSYHNSTNIQGSLEYLRFKAKFINLIKNNQVLAEKFDEVNLFLGKYNIRLKPLESYVKYTNLIIILADFFKKELIKNNAAIGVLIYYYGPEGMAFNLACKQIALPSIEIQHGVQGPMHRAYGRWSKVPADGYSLLPQYFWCWDQDSADAIEKWSSKLNIHKAFVGGNPWVDLWTKQDNVLANRLNQGLPEINPDKRDKVILVTLQTGREFPSIILEAMKDSSASWLWLIRLHPNMLEDEPNIRKKLGSLPADVKYEIDLSTELPLPYLLKQIDVHVTEWSSTVKEAKEYNKKSVVTHENGAELFKEEIEENAAVYMENAAELISFIDNVCGYETGPAGISQHEEGYDLVKQIIKQLD
ncbi:hypothetical protein [Mesobacillus jeotgali]|uniref:CDP-Glycerol:Poly(Glycerophosphate) glycerophosphotransferase n=1 Tax=Mesobacillus jeotgali TaxID=129985 RepID=A0ABY9VFP0_9BACI|nr:hypothetical protein [Mesobacillus jeotgali]WNF22640.1 hypothetical protein RH061_21200 [Mesobacillus jeotgali]